MATATATLVPFPTTAGPEAATGPSKFSANRKELLRELALTQTVREAKTTVPILSCLLIQVDHNQLTILATDLDQSIRTICPVTKASPGTIAMPGKKAFDYLKLLEGDEISFVGLDNNWTQIRCGRSKTKIVGMEPKNYPKIPEFSAKAEARVPVATLKALIGRVQFAISNQESRYTLNGALLTIAPDSVTMVATDGFRLSFAKSNETVAGLTSPKNYLVSLAGLKTLSFLLTNTEEEFVDFGCEDNTLFFRIGSRVLTVRRMTGQFPSYQQIMPQSASKKIEVSVKELGAAIQRVAQFADERSSIIRFSLAENTLRISSSSTESGESEEVMPITYSGESLAVGMNANFALDPLKVLGTAEVRLEMNGPTNVVEFRPVTEDNSIEYRGLVMPARG
ncbi:MAG TPA: DNA polymerase III subunit beta [Candidatus Binatia bacterium]|nr:DNA polymerase III subunit beta [Candidatus Binatia bacterium]